MTEYFKLPKNYNEIIKAMAKNEKLPEPILDKPKKVYSAFDLFDHMLKQNEDLIHLKNVYIKLLEERISILERKS